MRIDEINAMADADIVKNEILNKKGANHSVDANEIVSSVSLLIAEIQRRVALIQSEPQIMTRGLMIQNLDVDLEQYKAMHKKEVIDAYHINPLESKWKNIGKQYYNETFKSK